MSEKLTFEIIKKNGNPKILLNRPLTVDDIGLVTETCNAILFILEEDKGWETTGDKAVLKVRFKLAEEVEKLWKVLDSNDGVVLSYLIDLWQVHRLQVSASEVGPEREEIFKEEILFKLNKSIEMFNMKADLSF